MLLAMAPLVKAMIRFVLNWAIMRLSRISKSLRRREWDLTSRTKLIDYAEKHQINIPKDKRGEAPFSVDANLLYISAEGKVLEDPWVEPEEYVFKVRIAHGCA